MVEFNINRGVLRPAQFEYNLGWPDNRYLNDTIARQLVGVMGSKNTHENPSSTAMPVIY